MSGHIISYVIYRAVPLSNDALHFYPVSNYEGIYRHLCIPACTCMYM